MKKTMILTSSVVALLVTAAPALAADNSAEAREEVSRNNKIISEQNENLAVNRAEKAAAKRRGDELGQAAQSVQIGANKAVKAVHEDSNEYHRQAPASGDARAKRTPRDRTNSAQDIAKQKENLRVNRAEKEAAKRRDDELDQASQSVQIGANKTAIAGEIADRKREGAGNSQYGFTENRKPSAGPAVKP